jgi:hypothetical protein
MRFLTVCMILLATCGVASPQPVPLPRAKPLTSGTAYPPSMVPRPPALPLHDAEVWPSDCGLRLAEIARFAPQPTLNGPGQCGAADLVRLEEVTMTNSAPPVSVMPPATLRCSMAEAIARWVRNDLGAAMAELGSPPVALTNGGSYNCRGRNNDASAKISEHGRGNAFDLGSIKLANGAVMDLSNNRVTPESFRLRLRDATCHRFNTVLGPGSDPYHANHIHLDLAERARGYKMCQWDVGTPEVIAEVPIPKPSPLAESKLPKRPAKMGRPARRVLRSADR